MHQSPSDDVSGGWGCPLPKNSITEALYILGATIDFIDCWLKSLEQNSIERCDLYSHNMDILFQKIPVKLTNKTSPKAQIIITCYWRWVDIWKN